MFSWSLLAAVAAPLASLLLLVGLGAGATWLRLLDEERIKSLTEVTVGLLLPIFIFWEAATGPVADSLGQAPWMLALGLGGGLAAYLIAAGIAYLQHWDWRRRSVLQVSGATGNTGFLGIPLCTALYGAQGAILALLYDFCGSVLLMTVGIASLQGPGQLQGSLVQRLWPTLRRLLNPLLVSLLLGSGVALAGWSFPAILAQPIEQLAGTVVPLMMLLLGGIVFNLARRPGSLSSSVVWPAALKLTLLPALTLLAASLLRLPLAVRQVAVIEAAMPSGVTCTIFAQQYNADKDLAASATLVTTLFSALTVPLFALLAS